MKKLLFTLITLLLISISSFSQPGYPAPTEDIKWRDYITIDHIAGTKFNKPTIGLMLEREVIDEQYNFIIPARIGYWRSSSNISGTDVKQFFIIQMGLILKANQKVSFGTYWMNFQGNLPKSSKNPQDYNYYSPPCLFLKLSDKHFPQHQVYLEGSYYVTTKTPAFRFTYSYKIFNIPHTLQMSEL